MPRKHEFRIMCVDGCDHGLTSMTIQDAAWVAKQADRGKCGPHTFQMRTVIYGPWKPVEGG